MAIKMNVETPKSPIVVTPSVDVITIEKSLLALKLKDDKFSKKKFPKLYEEVPKVKIQAVIESGMLQEKWGDDLKQNDPRKLYHKNEVDQLEKYLEKHNNKDGVKVECKKAETNYGRVYPVGGIGSITIRTEVRNTLLNDIYADFDIENALPNILNQILIENEIQYDTLKYYCENRNEVIHEISNHFGLTSDDGIPDKTNVKQLFISLSFGGGYEEWCRKNNIPSTFVIPDIIIKYKEEMSSIMKLMYSSNDDLTESVKLKNKNCNDTHDNLKSALSIYLQEKECRVVTTIIQECINKKLMTHSKNPKIYSGAYQYDGIQLPTNNVKNFLWEGKTGIEAVCKFLEFKTTQQTGFKLRWVNKPYGEVFDLNSTIKDIEESKHDIVKQILFFQDIITKSHQGVVEFIIDKFPDYFHFCLDTNKWYCWNDVDNRYETNALVIKDKMGGFFVKEIQDIQNQYITDRMDEVQTDLKKVTDKLIMRLCDTQFQNNVVSSAKTLCRTDTFECNKKPYLLGFDNGVLDLENKVFRKYTPSDRVTISCGNTMDFTYLELLGNYKDEVGCSVTSKKECRKLIEYISTNIFNKIFTDEIECSFFKEILATGLIGISIEKFFILIGDGSNGKSLITEMMGKVLGKYAKCNARPQIITEKSNKKSADGHTSSKTDLEFKRFIVMEECDANDKINSSTMKSYTGSAIHSGRGCGAGAERNYWIPASWGITTNSRIDLDVPTISNGERRRIVELVFKSKFVENERDVDEENNIFLQDPQIKVNMDLYILPFLHLLIKKFEEMFKRKGRTFIPDIPQSVVDNTNIYILNTNPIFGMINKLYDFDETLDKCESKTSTTIYSEIKDCEQWSTMANYEKKRFTTANIKEFLMGEGKDFFDRYTHEDKKNKCYRFKFTLKEIDENED